MGFWADACLLHDQAHFVFYNDCVEEFSEWQAAMESFGYGLSNGCRLREYSRRSIPYRWMIELQDIEGTWWPYWETTACRARSGICGTAPACVIFRIG
jgi:hypothetical protein